MTAADRAKMSAAKKGRRLPQMARVATEQQRATLRASTAAMLNDPARRDAWIEANRKSHSGRPWTKARREAYERMKLDPSRLWTHKKRAADSSNSTTDVPVTRGAFE